MKNNYLSFLVLALFAFGCTAPDEILDDFQVHISPSFYKYVIEVNVEDLANPENAITGNIAVSVTGEDADAVYNIDGTRNYQVNYGTLQLMIARDFEPTANDPVRFTLSFEANGFQKTNLPMQIGEEDFFVADVAQMLNLSTLPNSIGNTTSNGAVDPTTNTLAQPLVVNTGSPDSLSKIELVIPNDVKFLDADGNEIVAKRGGTGLNVNVLSLSDTSEVSQMAMPNGTGMLQMVEADGQIDTVVMEQTGSYNITMDLDGVPVRGFSGGKTSGGVTTRIPIPDGTYNLEFNRAYQEGDSISLMSLSEGDDNWKLEGRSAVVEKDPATGELFVNPTITHLSWWRWRRWRRWWYPPVYRFGLGAYYTDPANANGAVNGTIIARYRHTYSWWWGSRSYYFRIQGNFGPNWRRNPRRFIRTRTPWGSPNVVYTSFSPATFDITNENETLYGYNFRVLKIEPKTQPPSIGYRLFCSGSNTLVTPPPGVKMYYRKTNSGDQFQHLYTFTQQNINVTYASFPALENNTAYDFRAQFNDVQKDTANVVVVDGRIYTVTLPKSACNALGI